MAQIEKFGHVREVRIFDNSKKGEIIFRSDTGDLKLKLSNDHDSAFSGMAAVASAAIEFGDLTPASKVPNVHVKYDDDDMEIDEIAFHWHP
jgi:hypothetical protein